ncbi:MAG: pilus assembly protein [Porphyrobacter sp.]|nr:pilus assembly protein [Porphyrobacter sp.]
MRHYNVFRHLLNSQSGASAAEFALIVPLIVLLITAAIDFGGLIYTRLQVASATHAGASFASTQAFDVAAITTAIAGGASIAVTAATPLQTCGCPNASTGIALATCGDTCTAGGAAGKYVTVSASMNYSLIYPWPGLSNPVSISSTATVRIP